MSRCKLTEIQTSHKNCERFPYSADELALYMQHLCDIMEPVVEEEYDDHSAESEDEEKIERGSNYRENVINAGLPIAPHYNDDHLKAR